ncbi:hypothetical protein [Chryseosolibacter indicus]|uniref:Uncharacterized protein n=1 Tax=Chryseosolibacter indicus TaxID=2782351 RepID=A0ABS5VTZ0_9BACT|nr:hypothetical protein [Chryseosolibacter indicus]MBT1704883.1 hypothetical protein [Chryseosolibacter indicus]
MSRQIGLIKVKGNLDGVSFYQSNGENFVRMAKGPDKNRIMNDPAFKRTRENNREFSGSAIAAKACREALMPALKVADHRLTSRTLKLIRSVHSKSKGVRGERPIEISLNKGLLENFEFNETIKFTSIFKHKPEIEAAPDRISGKLSIPEFSLSEGFKPPKDATHLRFMYAMGTISDFAFDKATTKFNPVAPKLNGLYAVSYSEYFDINTIENVSVTLEASLANNPVLTDKVSVMHGVGIMFYKQEDDDALYPLKQGNAFKIVSVV